MADFTKTIKNDRGELVEIRITYIDRYGLTNKNADKCFTIAICDLAVKPPRAKKWRYIMSEISDDYDYRALPFGVERERYKTKVFLRYITPNQAKAAIAEAWEAIKPDTSYIDEIASEGLE